VCLVPLSGHFIQDLVRPDVVCVLPEGRAPEERLTVPRATYDMLYEYQRYTLEWLWGLHLSDMGAILGDDMGLGKVR
jgi:SNF2 family DNA or RNA helicase